MHHRVSGPRAGSCDPGATFASRCRCEAVNRTRHACPLNIGHPSTPWLTLTIADFRLRFGGR
jgi:hypothetical protein